MKMIKQECIRDLKAKLVDAVRCSYSMCADSGEYDVVSSAIVEFFTAINLDDSDAIDVLRRASGMCVDSDDCIDKLIEAFQE